MQHKATTGLEVEGFREGKEQDTHGTCGSHGSVFRSGVVGLHVQGEVQERKSPDHTMLDCRPEAGVGQVTKLL